MKRFVFAFVFVACCAPLPALRAEGEPRYVDAAWTLTSAVSSHYVLRGVERAEASFQPGVDFISGDWSAGVWASAALDRGGSAAGDYELDLYGAYTMRLNDLGVELLPGFVLYTYPEAKRSEGHYRATFEPSLAADVMISGIRFTPKCYYDVTRRGTTFECTAAVALPLTALGTEIALSAAIGTFRWDDVSPDAAVKNWGDYWSVSAHVPYQLSAHSRIALGVTYAEGRNNFLKTGTQPKIRNPAAVGRAAVTLSYSLSL